MMRLTFDTVAPHYFYLYVQPLHAAPLLPERLRAGLTIRPLESHEAEQVALVRPHNPVMAWFERGDICLGAHRGDELVGHIWLHFGPFDDVTSRIRFVPTPTDVVSWDLDIHVVPHERAGLVFAALWDAASELLRERGYEWTASYVSAFNGPSLRAHERLGARRVGTVVFFRLGPFQVTATSLEPRFNISFHPKMTPTIAVTVPELEAKPEFGRDRPLAEGTPPESNVGG